MKKILTVCLIGLTAHAEINEPIQPLPDTTPKLDSATVALGKKLFHEPLLSKTNQISCSSCHDLQRGGSDGQIVSRGINGAKGEINAPSVYNSGFNFRQFWNGRAKTLEEQVDGPIQNAVEMGNTWDEVVAKLKSSKEYPPLFSGIFRDGITPANIKTALATFERGLTTPNSAFDRYLRGDANAISTQQKIGYQKFKALGCAACHQGMNVGGNMFQTMGVMGNYFKDRGRPETEADWGRYNVTKNSADKHVFKVPGLRNIAKTAPYFHDGSAKTLEEAVSIMGRYQLGKILTRQDIDDLVAFLNSLSGEMPELAK